MFPYFLQIWTPPISGEHLAVHVRNEAQPCSPPQHWCQEQTQCGNTKDQQVDLQKKDEEINIESRNYYV